MGNTGVGYKFNDKIEFLVRYDYLDPHTGVSGNREEEISAGIVLWGSRKKPACRLWWFELWRSQWISLMISIVLSWKFAPRIKEKK